jgi:uncharacterized membrane protein
MSPELAAIAFGVASAVAWGAGDFSGGLATRRASVFRVAVLGNGTGLALLVLLAFTFAEPLPSTEAVGWGLAAGLSGGIGGAALFRALAVGRMGVASPLTAVLAVAVSVLFGAFVEGVPQVLQLVGFGVAVLGIWFVSRPENGIRRPQGLDLAVVGGLGFGGFFVLLSLAGATTVWWPLAAARASSFVLMLGLAMATRREWRPSRRLLPLVVLYATLDIGGSGFFVLATQVGRLDVAAVLSSLYPAGTVLLARAVLRERVTRTQGIGISAALVAILLIAAP